MNLHFSQDFCGIVTLASILVPENVQQVKLVLCFQVLMKIPFILSLDYIYIYLMCIYV